MRNIFKEASKNIRSLNAVDSIIENDDIPWASKLFLISVMSSAVKAGKAEQRNADAIYEIFNRVDKDMRLFRNFLGMVVDLANHFKIEHMALVFAIKHISLRDHFNSFLDFAERKNPIIKKDSPLQLCLTLGLSIIKLALNNQNMNRTNAEQNLRRQREKDRLQTEYRKLHECMSERFINLDFGLEMVNHQSSDIYASDLTNFNRDDDEDENCGEGSSGSSGGLTTTTTTVVDITPKNCRYILEATAASSSIVNTIENYNDSLPSTSSSILSARNNIEEDIVAENVVVTAAAANTDMNITICNSDEDSGIKSMDGSDVDILKSLQHSSLDYLLRRNLPVDDNTNTMDVLKTLENGDKEVNLTNLDSIFTEASVKFGPEVLKTVVSFSSVPNTNDDHVTTSNTITNYDDDDDDDGIEDVSSKPTVFFNNYNRQTMVDFH